MADYSEKQNFDLAMREYNPNLHRKSTVIIDGGLKVGYVSEVVHRELTGLDAYVITDKPLGKNPTQAQLDSVKHVTVLYQGSYGNTDRIDKVVADWVINDLPLAKHLEVPKINGQTPTIQLLAGSKLLTDTFSKYRNADVSVYGHSLGSMVGQYAIANLASKYHGRLDDAHLYEGMNIYNLLTDDQKRYADELAKSGKVRNYVDPKDIVPLNTYTRSKKAVGSVTFVDTKKVKSPVNQHMGKGYQFNKDQSLKTLSRTAVTKYLGPAYKATHKYATAKLTKLSALKKKFIASGGGMSGSEKVMLDEASAYVVASTIETAVNVASEELEKTLKHGRHELTEIWNDGIKLARQLAPDLSDEEIYQALSEVGVTKRSIVTLAHAGFDADLNDLREMTDKYKTLVTDVKHTIDQIKGADEQMKAIFD